MTDDITTTTFRAAYWLAPDGQSDVLLTREDQSHLPVDALIAAARREAEENGIDIDCGMICVGEYRMRT